MSLATYYLDYGRHVALLRRRRRRAYEPTSNTASHDNHEKINSWVSFAFLYVFEYGAPLGGPSGRRSSAINHLVKEMSSNQCEEYLLFRTLLVLYHLSLVGLRISLLKEGVEVQLTGILVTSGLQNLQSL